MLEVGILKNFDSGTYKAGVQLAGSLTTYFDDISVAKNIPSSALVIGNYVIVAIPGGNPKDACVIATWPQGSPGGGAGSFLDLSDTPSSYSSQAGKIPKVKTDETALEFKEPASLDWELNDETEGDHFKQNAATYPPGWTEVDAAKETNTNRLFHFWFLRGNSVDTTWDYRKQTGVGIENTSSGRWNSFVFGPILFRDGEYTADLHCYFGIYGETGGAIDLDKYVRVHLWWDSANLLWKVRGESRAGSGDTETSSAWRTFTFPLNQPIYLRVMIRNVAAKTCRSYIGTQPICRTQSIFQSVGESATWGQVYWRVNLSRGSGLEDYLYIGAIDYYENEP